MVGNGGRTRGYSDRRGKAHSCAYFVQPPL
jgi:hypothetical protein